MLYQPNQPNANQSDGFLKFAIFEKVKIAARPRPVPCGPVALSGPGLPSCILGHQRGVPRQLGRTAGVADAAGGSGLGGAAGSCGAGRGRAAV